MAKSPPPSPAEKNPLQSSLFHSRVANLSQTEKDRIVCAVLHGTLTNVDWEAAAKIFGSASRQSMQKSYQNAIKKVGATKKDTDETNENTKANNEAAILKKRKRLADKDRDTTPKKVKTEDNEGGME